MVVDRMLLNILNNWKSFAGLPDPSANTIEKKVMFLPAFLRYQTHYNFFEMVKSIILNMGTWPKWRKNTTKTPTVHLVPCDIVCLGVQPIVKLMSAGGILFCALPLYYSFASEDQINKFLGKLHYVLSLAASS